MSKTNGHHAQPAGSTNPQATDGERLFRDQKHQKLYEQFTGGDPKGEDIGEAQYEVNPDRYRKLGPEFEATLKQVAAEAGVAPEDLRTEYGAFWVGMEAGKEYGLEVA